MRGNRFIRFILDTRHRHGQLTTLCPLDPPSETASVTAVSILGNVRLEHSQPRPTMTGPAESEERWVNRWGKWRRGSCPNPNLILIIGEEGFQARSAESECSFLNRNRREAMALDRGTSREAIGLEARPRKLRYGTIT